MPKSKILCVDLDGTFIKTDMLYETFFYTFFRNPFIIILSFIWLLSGGKVKLKEQLANRYFFTAKNIPINESVREIVINKKRLGYKIFLVSASYNTIVSEFFKAYSDLFDGFYATEDFNLSSKRKALFLNGKFGKGNYEYIGNSKDDIAVWNNCSYAYCVTQNTSIINEIEVNKKQLVSGKQKKSFIERIKIVIKQLRCHQWAKNALIAVPVLSCAQILPIHHYLMIASGIFAFSLIASSVYIINDIIDLDNDRAHQTKCKRPIASCKLSLIQAVLLLTCTLSIGLVLSSIVSSKYLLLCLIYLVFNLLYSVKLKSVLILDCIILSIMYTYRILIGSVIADLSLSIWLLTFSFFIFLSLAFVKRYIELYKLSNTQNLKAKGRRYEVKDLQILQVMSVAAGFTATLILNLYFNDTDIKVHFKNIYLAYTCLPILVYWLCRIYIKASRGSVSDDPVYFALKDRISQFVAFLFCSFFWAGIYLNI